MWVLHSWSPWLTHSNTFLMWHSYFNTIFIYSFKISLNHNSEKCWREDKLLELYNFPQSWKGGRGRRKKVKEYILFKDSQQNKEYRVNSVQFTIFKSSSQYCSKCHPKPLPPRKKIYSKSKTILQYSNRGGEVPENPKRPQPLIRSLTHTRTQQSCTMTDTASTQRKVNHTCTHTKLSTRCFWRDVKEVRNNQLKRNVLWGEREKKKQDKKHTHTHGGVIYFYTRAGSGIVSRSQTVREAERWGVREESRRREAMLSHASPPRNRSALAQS